MFDLGSTELASVLALVTDGRWLWAGGSAKSGEGGRVAAIDLARGNVVYDVAVPDAVLGLTIDPGLGTVWAVGGGDGADPDGGISRLDARTGDTRGTTTIERGSPYAVALGPLGSPWVTDASRNLVYVVDARSGAITKRVEVGSGPISLAATRGAGWVAASRDSALVHLDNDARVRSTVRLESSSSVAATSTDVWVGGQQVVHLAVGASPAVTRTVPLPALARIVGVGGGWVWTLANDGTIRRINTETGAIDANTLFVRGSYTALLGSDALYIAAGAGSTPAVGEYRLPLPAAQAPPRETLPTNGQVTARLYVDGGGSLEADVIEPLAGDAAIAAARTDGRDIPPNESIPNDYYDRNRDGTRYRLSLKPSATITILDAAPDRTRTVSVGDLEAALRTPAKDRRGFYGLLETPFEVTLADGHVTAVRQEYRP